MLLLADPAVARNTTHPQQSRVEAVMGAQPDGDYDGQGQRTDMPQERITEGNGAEEEAGSGGDREQQVDERLVKAAKIIQKAYRHRLEQQRALRDNKAKKIQVAYLRYLKRKKIVRKGIEATQARYWQLLRKRSMEMKWTKDSQYHLLFRVPLAHILVCLDVIGEFVESKKKKAKKRVTAEGDKDLEESMEALQKYRCDGIDRRPYQFKNSNGSPSKLLKKTIELQKKLSPSSKFHEGKSVSDLQRAILEVKVIVESLDDIPESVGTRNQIEGRWERGYKWIFEKQGGRAKGKKADKPKLVLDREDLLYS
jgi:hypothetical protein